MIVYLSTAASKEMLTYCHNRYATKKIVYVQQQWDYTLCRALSQCFGDTFAAVSYPPVQTFPSGKCFAKKMCVEREEAFDVHYCGFLNLPVIKQATSARSVVRIIRKIMHHRGEQDLTVITHCFYPQSFYAIEQLKKQYNVKVFTVIPDLPDFAYSNLNEKHKLLARLWKHFNQMKQELKSVPDGYICFSEYQRRYLDPQKPYIVMEGFADTDSFDKIAPSTQDTSKKIFLYAGALKENYGVDNLIRAFHALERDDCELWLYGEGESKKLVEEIGDPKIQYRGCASKEEIVALEKSAYMLVNPRPSEEEYAKCSFPSKLLEYMSSGTPVLTTRLESMPESYLDKLLFIEDASQSGIGEALNSVLAMSEESLCELAERARHFIATEKTPLCQAQRIKDFILRCE